MAGSVKIEVKEGNPLAAVQSFLKGLLESGAVDALLVAQHLPAGGAVMPMLVTRSEHLDRADPLAPAFPLNAARVLARLTRRPSGRRLAAVLRPCEMRAFIELVKLKQGSMDDVVLIGADCLGACTNADYPRFAGDDGMGATLRFLEGALMGDGASEGIAPACRACEHPIPEQADLAIGLLGTRSELLLLPQSARGEALCASLGLPEAEVPRERQEAVSRLLDQRIPYRDRMFEATRAAVDDLEKLGHYLSRCVNCANCRVACPVCYCRECVFLTDVFDHEPAQVLRWAARRGGLKMPTDTLFYHLTRLTHMSLSCVGCGQCSNACPNGIPVMELFRTLAGATQAAFGYVPGRSLDEPLPLSVFHEHEFTEVTGGKE